MDGAEPMRPPAVRPTRLVVLMYHGLHHHAAEPHFDPRYSVLPVEFERQMRLLAARRGRAWLPGQPAGGAATEAPEVMVSFDDGAASDYEIAVPCLRAQGLRAMFFVTSGFVGRPGRVTRLQLRAMVEAGMAIGAHGRQHLLLATLPLAQLREELRRSREELEQMLGRPVDRLALPGGRGGRRELEEALAAGYREVYGSRPGDNAVPARDGIVQRVPVVRDTGLRDFSQLIDWRGPAVRRLRWRHRLLQAPKRVLGDARFDRLRQWWTA